MSSQPVLVRLVNHTKEVSEIPDNSNGASLLGFFSPCFYLAAYILQKRKKEIIVDSSVPFSPIFLKKRQEPERDMIIVDN